MKKIQLLLLCIVLIFHTSAQTKHNVAIVASAGYNLDEYMNSHGGDYFKIGIEKKIIKQLYLNLSYWHSQSSSFPATMHVYSFQSGQESELLKHFMGYTFMELINGKGEYTLSEGDILSLTTNYQFNIRKFYITPKIGINIIRGKKVSVGLYEMHFDNDGKSIGGKLGYDMRMSLLPGCNFGFNFGYKASKNLHFFIDLEDIRDLGTGGFNWYASKNMGIGMKYFIQKKPCAGEKNSGHSGHSAL